MAEETRATEVQEVAEGNVPAADEGKDTQPITVESLMAEMSQLKAENAKNKAALDKALHNNGELTKQLRAKMSASEQEAEAKRQAEEAQANRIRDLEEYKARSEARERYIAIGMSADLAKEAAEAEVARDMESLTAIYKRHNEATLKASKDEWLKSRPEPATSRSENAEKEDPFLVGFNKGL